MVARVQTFLTECAGKASTWVILFIGAVIVAGADALVEKRVRPIARDEAEKVGQRLVDSSRIAENARFDGIQAVFDEITLQNREIRIYLEYKDPKGWARAKRAAHE